MLLLMVCPGLIPEHDNILSDPTSLGGITLVEVQKESGVFNNNASLGNGVRERVCTEGSLSSMLQV